MSRSFLRLTGQPLHFDADQLVSLRFDSPSSSYENLPSRLAVAHRILDRARAIPGVQTAELISGDPLSRTGIGRGMLVEGRPAQGAPPNFAVRFMDAGPQTLRTLGIPVVAGRDILPEDGQPGREACVVSESFARLVFPNENALGKRIRYVPPTAKWMTIVGIARDARLRHVRRDPSQDPQVYVPLRQQNEVIMELSLIARTATPNQTLTALREAVRAEDPEIAILSAEPVAARLAAQRSSERNLAALITALAALSSLLAVVGIGGVLAAGVRWRTREIGVRMALGSTSRGVVALVLREGAAVLAIGLAIGFLLAAAQAKWLETLLFGVRGMDLWAVLGSASALMICGALAAAAPAWLAARVSPVEALRDE